MKICFILNKIATEKSGSSIALMAKAHEMDHIVRAAGVGDFNLDHKGHITIDTTSVKRGKKIKNPEEFRRINNIFKFFADIILYDKTPSPLAKIFFYVTPKKRIYSNGLRRKTIQIVFDILSFQSCKDLIIYYCSYLKQLVIKNKWNDIDR